MRDHPSVRCYAANGENPEKIFGPEKALIPVLAPYNLVWVTPGRSTMTYYTIFNFKAITKLFSEGYGFAWEDAQALARTVHLCGQDFVEFSFDSCSVLVYLSFAKFKLPLDSVYPEFINPSSLLCLASASDLSTGLPFSLHARKGLDQFSP